MKSVLLINSPLHLSGTPSTDSLPPLGLAYMATQLAKSGISVTIHDCIANGYNEAEFSALVEQHTHIGFNIFSTNFGIVSKLISSIPSGHEILVGGMATFPLAKSIADIDSPNPIHVVCGEADFALAHIVHDSYPEQVQSLSPTRFIYTVDKDNSLFPKDIKALELDRSHLPDFGIVINRHGDREAGIITSRGCIYKCAFCGAAGRVGGKITVRLRKPESVKDEIEQILPHDIQGIRILDDLFLRDNATMGAAARLFSPLPVYWRSMAHIHSFRETSDQLIADMKESGCREIFCGVESGSNEIIKKINKKHTPDEVYAVVSKLLRAGIDVKCYFIFGFPGETARQMQETFELAGRLKDASFKTDGEMRASVFRFRPYHGTVMYNEIYGNDIVLDHISEDVTLTQEIGRRNFNFAAGNYSDESESTLITYIKETIDYCKR